MGKLAKVALGVVAIAATGGFGATALFGAGAATTGGVLATALGASTAAAQAIGIAGGILGSQLLSSALAPSPPDITPSSIGDALGTRQASGVSTSNKIPVLYGSAWTSGVSFDIVLSTDNKTIYQAIALTERTSGTNNVDVSQIYYGGRKITFDSTDQTKVVSLTNDDGTIDTSINGNLFIYIYHNGSSSAGQNTSTTAFNLMNDSGIPSADRWLATSACPDMTFVIVKQIYNQTNGITALQPSKFKITNTLTAPGSVWYDYMTNARYGARRTNVDTTSRDALDTYSAQQITYTPYGGTATTQNRYKISGILNTSRSCYQCVNDILAAADSSLTYSTVTGLWRVLINKEGTPALNFDDSNIIGAIDFSPKQQNEIYNGINLTFPDTMQQDQSNNAFIDYSTNLQSAGEEPNRLDVTVVMSNDNVQCQYLAGRAFKNSRSGFFIKFEATFTAVQLEEGDLITVTNPVFGWTNKVFRVNSLSIPNDNSGLRATIYAAPYDPNVYTNDGITSYQPPPNVGTPNPNSFSSLAAPTVVNPMPMDAVPFFNVDFNLSTTGTMNQYTLYYSPDSTFTPNARVLSSFYSPTPLTQGQSLSILSTGLPAGTYYFFFTVANSETTSAFSATSSAFTWSPQPTGSTSGVAVNPEWNPSALLVPATNAGMSTTLGQQAILALYLGTNLLSYSTAATDVAMPVNSWRIDVASASAGLTMTAGTPTSTTATYTVTALTAQQATFTVSMRYKNGSGVVTALGDTVLQVSQARAGSDGTIGTNGTPGAGSYFVTITDMTVRAPTNAEFSAVAGRFAIVNDLCTVQPGTLGSTTTYKCLTSGLPSVQATWQQVNQYIPGSLLVQNTVTTDRINITSGTLRMPSTGTSYVLIDGVNNRIDVYESGTLRVRLGNL